MRSLIDMITAFIALLVSAAFMHFGADSDAVMSRPEPPADGMSANHSSASDAPIP